MKKIILNIILAVLVLFSFQCQKSFDSPFGSNNGETLLPDPITASVQGFVINEDGKAAEGAIVKIGSRSFVTDNRGYFRATDASLDKNASVVTAEKAGYFTAIRTFSASKNLNQVVIKLIKKELIGTIQSSSGGKATLANGASITLPAAAVVNKTSGVSYSGEIKVYAAYINPLAEDIAEILPGSFLAKDKNGKAVMLQSYGMLAVELSGASGEVLQIATGKEAEISSPIPASLQNSGAIEMPMWHMNEKTGLWEEEGVAKKVGTNYVGKVSHFSYWNMDFPGPRVNVTGLVKLSNGAAATNMHVIVTLATNSQQVIAGGYTDSAGYFYGSVPASTDLKFLFYTYGSCPTAVHFITVTTSTTALDLGVIALPASNQSNLYELAGNIKDCNQQNVTNGHAFISSSNIFFSRYVAVDANGNYSTTIISCVAPIIDIIGVDASNMVQSSSQNLTLSQPATNTVNLTACGNSASAYFNFILDGVTHSLYDSLVANNYVLNNIKYHSIRADKIYTVDRVAVNYSTSNNVEIGDFALTLNAVVSGKSYTQQNPMVVTITETPAAIGQFYKGSFVGKCMDSTANTIHDVSGSFRVRRDY